jgi:uncharacterized protein (TIGR02145 family)
MTKIMKAIIISLFAILTTGLSIGQTGSITNVTTSQRTDGSAIVDIYYDLAGTISKYKIDAEVSFNGGINFTPINQVSNDIGCGVTTGNQKHIVWNFGSEFPGNFSTETKIRLTASYCCGFVLVDSRDGQSYNTVQIGDQCWLAANLNIGAMIPGSNNMTNNSVIEKYCYNDNPANCNVYGGLYLWDEMMSYVNNPGVQGICPVGWHLPSDPEWMTLRDFLGGSSVAGGKIKEAGTSHWLPPNGGATNESGFTALPGGQGHSQYFYLGEWAFFHSSTEYSTEYAMTWFISYEFPAFFGPQGDQKTWEGKSVRCVKDN